MRKFFRRATAAVLAFILCSAPVASASVALGDDLILHSVSLSQGTALTSGVFWSNTYSDLRTEHYITYTPNPNVVPVVSTGDYLLSRTTLSTLARKLEARGQRVVGGINGDYYVMTTGQPCGLVITDGVLRSTDAGLYAVGFLSDGTVFLGKPALSVTATFSDYTFKVADINKVRTATGGYYLLTDDFSATTLNSEPGIDVILTPVLDNLGQPVPIYTEETQDPEGQNSIPDPAGESIIPPPNPFLQPEPAQQIPQQSSTSSVSTATLIQSARPTVGGRVTYVVEQVLKSQGSISIPKGKAVLTINQKSNEWLVSQLANLKPGDTVQLDVTSSDPRWAQASYGVGAMYKLVTNGAVEPGLEAGQYPRSVVGIRADGTAVFYTIDGRQSGYSVGATMTQVAQRLVELGCVEAVCLDGGGSTTMGATYPNANAFRLVNKSSDGSERANSNAIFLVSSLKPTNLLDHLYVTPGDALLLPGASVSLSAAGIDTAWYPTSYTPTPSWAVTQGEGTVSPSGVFTAGASGGVSVVTASVGSATGSAAITVIPKPDSIALYNETTGAKLTSLALSPGETVELQALATYRNLPLISQDSCFIWQADPSAGTVTQDGTFTAAPKTGTGSLTVSVGGRSVTIPVTVTGHVLLLEDFEAEELNTFVSTSTAQVSLQKGSELVRYGYQSLKLSYDASVSASAAVAVFLPVEKGEKYLNLWVYGDGSHNTLTATLLSGTGERKEVPIATLDFTGWQYCTASLPGSGGNISALTISPTGGIPSGTIYLDQITTSNEPIYDVTPPVVTVSVSDGMLLASAVDTVTRTFDKSRIQVTRDGEPLDFVWDAAEGVATAKLPPNDGKLHRFTVTATDLCGNIGRGSYDLTPEAQIAVGQTACTPEEAMEAAPDASPFVDMEGHWADDFTTFLYDHQVTQGIATPGGLQFQPEKQITRGEFFLMLARWLKLDLNAYQSVTLPFVDSASIPDWALPGVKAMFAMGILKGSGTADALYANASAPISRAEAMTLLGRLQPRGYAESQLTSFTDAQQVPDWALLYVRSLVGQGVVSGFINQIFPTSPLKRGEVAKMLYTLL